MSPTERVRVIIADDHAMVREGLRSMLPPQRFQVVGEAANGRQAVELVGAESPDIVLLDVRMPEMDGLTALGMIKAQRSETRVVIVTTYEDQTYLIRAIAAGASGYILKGIRRQELVQALETVMDGDSIIDPSMLRSVLQHVTGGSDGSSGAVARAQLSEREVEVLRLVAAGMTNREIGERLFITEGTARAHLHNILTKLGVSDRTQAAVWAAREGLLEEG